MTLTEFKSLLETTGFPVAYMQFKKAPKTPYIVYYNGSSQNFVADNRVYHEAGNVTVELYTDYKDEAAEAKVKQALNDNDLPFDNFEAWIESESLLQNSFETRLL